MIIEKSRFNINEYEIQGKWRIRDPDKEVEKRIKRLRKGLENIKRLEESGIGECYGGKVDYNSISSKLRRDITKNIDYYLEHRILNPEQREEFEEIRTSYNLKKESETYINVA